MGIITLFHGTSDRFVFNDKYNQRDADARKKMKALIDSDANKVTKVFSTLFEE
ncbi:MAG: hypothetical protein IKO68_04685 [Oscillospiraceae bacterium]|nr:hypothetical protein [Oscillospiraceae bacterium]